MKSLHIESLARVRETSEERTEVTMSRVEEGAIPIPDARHKEFTLVLVRDYPNEKVLLGEKLRGFGTGCVDDSRV